MENQPLRRHMALRALSRDHHEGLLLCWKIRTGLTKQIDTARIKRYATWFYQHHLQPHFALEEKLVFVLIGTDHEMVKKAMADHRRLKRLFEDDEHIDRSLSLIEEELEKHIRFEERMLFQEIQHTVSTDELEQLATTLSEAHGAVACPQWEDEFWKA